MAENRRGREIRFYFSRGQLILLGGAFALASAIIFIIGMLVGKGIEERKIIKRDEPLVKIPVKPTPQESSAAPASAPKDVITFNEPASKSPSDASPVQEPAKPAEKTTEKRAASEAPTKIREATDTAAAKEAGKPWRAQVNAYPDERSAKLIVDRLKNKGYNAYVTEAQNKGKTWYRVNVGRYGSREEAEKIVEVLRSKENFSKAFVAAK